MKWIFTVCIICFVLPLHAQVAQPGVPTADSAKSPFLITNIYKNIIDSNHLLNAGGIPVSLPVIQKKREEKQGFFYLIAGLLLMLGILKTLYKRYFTTLFRVFFNTSLRQNQLTDQLEQAKLPSLFFNIYFILSAGVYIYFLLRYFSVQGEMPDWYLLGVCTAAVGTCYFVKYLSLLFTGWVTGYKGEAGIYIFIIFLHNKIIGILLLPLIALIAFSSKAVVSFAVSGSIILLCMILLMRFYRSYSLLQSKLKMTGFHFLLYIISFELLPLALIYRVVTLFFSINS